MPGEAVTLLANLRSEAECEPDAAIAALHRAGASTEQARRAYFFAQTAWGRVVLDGLGITFSPQYNCLAANGAVISTGSLEGEQHFVEAMRVAQQSPTLPAIRTFALMSAEFNAVNNALNGGSKPENLVLSPVTIFLESATAAHKSKQPWWRFW